MSELYLSVTIANRDDQERFINFYQKHNIPIVHSALGSGTASSSVLNYLGLEASEKAVMFSVSREERVRRAMKDLRNTLYLDVPGNGIAMGIPISSIGGKTMRFMDCPHPMEEPWSRHGKSFGGESMNEAPFRLIIVIANQGYSDLVMEAAKQGGAGGGTVIRAKGTGTEHVEKFFGISIAEEKEMIFIACQKKDKSAIMKAIMTDAGFESKAQSLVLAIPVDSLLGIREQAEDEDEGAQPET
ncbi:MAG: P-II family nitrogen regulator [Clostridiales bacterium]|nr:P-II family nitrogen regulator [Clostridiales bacterium]